MFRSDPPTGLTTPRIHARRIPASGGASNNTSLAQKTLSWKRWKRKTNTKTVAAEKLLIPLPIPHPVFIAIGIYNRDSDQPIPLDTEICWDILRAIEESNGDVQVNQQSSLFTSLNESILIYVYLLHLLSCWPFF